MRVVQDPAGSPELRHLRAELKAYPKEMTPKVKNRVEVLREIQGQSNELEAKFFEERAALEAKYQKLYEPYYAKRYEIVNGIVEVEGSNEEVALPDGEEAIEERGVPCFWLIAMKAHEFLMEEITERDKAALKYLKDIKCHKIDDPKGFKLEFFFDTNPFFKNSVLTKTYHMVEEGEPVLEKAIGTEIEWYPGKCLTKKLLKKKPKKGSSNAKTITKIEDCESFFTFFSPPPIPENEDEIDDGEADDDLKADMERRYDIASAIRDQIIPNAVSYFTGEVNDCDSEIGADEGIVTRWR